MGCSTNASASAAKAGSGSPAAGGAAGLAVGVGDVMGRQVGSSKEHFARTKSYTYFSGFFTNFQCVAHRQSKI
jgi:hypothetical protein